MTQIGLEKLPTMKLKDGTRIKLSFTVLVDGIVTTMFFIGLLWGGAWIIALAWNHAVAIWFALQTISASQVFLVTLGILEVALMCRFIYLMFTGDLLRILLLSGE